MAVIEVILFAYLGGCILYNLIFSIAACLSGKKPVNNAAERDFSRIAILVPAYREDDVILSTARSYGQLNYPAGYATTVVIADSLQSSTLLALKELNVTVIPVSFEKSTKAKSINVAFEQLPDEYDMAIICDADNIPEKDFLLKVNAAYQAGEHAIQTNRVAKNMDTTFAILDSANEIIANHIYRKGANALGLSSSVIGSGMAFHYPLIKEIMQEVNAVGGFDKVLQLEVIKRGHVIYFLEDAHIFDEKVPGADAFKHQRRRWLSSQWVYLKQFFVPGFKALFRGELNYFNLSVCQNMLLPRMLLLAGTGLLAVSYLVIGKYLFVPAYAWWVLLAMYAVSLMIALPAMFYSKYMLRAIAGLPRALGIMVGLVFRLKGANNTFIHTKHSKTQIDNPLLDAVKK